MLIAPTIASDNTQGKSSRYKTVAKRQAPNLSLSIAISNPVINNRRLRLAVVPNDNTNGKSSRFKGLATERDCLFSIQLSLTQHHLGHINECVLPLSFITFALSPPLCRPGHVTVRVPRILCSFNISSTSLRPPDSQALRYLSEDPPHRQITQPPPSTVSTLPPLQILLLHQRSSPLTSSTPPLFSILLPPSPPTPPPSTLPPSNVAHGHQPSNVYYVPPPLVKTGFRPRL